MAGIRLRRAGIDDAEGVARIQHASWQQAYLGMLPHEILIGMDQSQGTAFWQRVLGQREHHDSVIVAELDDEPLGFVSFGPIRQRIPGYSSEFYALYVLPEAQGCGIGTALMAQAARALIRQRWIGATVWVLEDNHPGRRFYERLGGLPLGSPKTLRYRGQNYDAVREVAYGWPDLRQAPWLVEN